MHNKTLASSLLAVLLVFAFVQYNSVATSDGFYWPGLSAEEEASIAIDVQDDGSEAAPKKKGGNGFVRALGAPFRAIGRVFGGGKKNNEQARRTSRNDAEKFESTKLARIKDANTAAVAANSTAGPSTAQSSASDFQEHYSRGRQLLLSGDTNAALAELTAAATINPKSAEVNRLLGVAYESRGMRDSALKAFQAAVNADDDNAQHLNNLGFLLYKNGDYERATKYLRRAAKLDQKNVRILNNLGLAYCERGKFDDAYKSFALAAGEFGGRMSIAAQLQQRGYAKDAIKHLEKAQAMRPNSSDVLAKLVSLYQMTGRPTDAENARRAIVALETSAGAKK